MMPLNVGDVEGELAGLSLEEEGFVSRFSRRLWLAGGAVADDDERMSRRMGIDIRVYRRILSTLLEARILERVDGTISSPRITATLRSIAAKRTKAAAAGALGAQARKDMAMHQTTAQEVRRTSPVSQTEVHRKQAGKRNKNKSALMAYPEPKPYPNNNKSSHESRPARDLKQIADRAEGLGVPVADILADLQGLPKEEAVAEFVDRCITAIEQSVRGAIDPVLITQALRAPDTSAYRAVMNAVMHALDQRPQKVGPASGSLINGPNVSAPDLCVADGSIIVGGHDGGRP